VRALKRERDIDDDLRRFPGIAKWVQTCVGCGARGYRPDLPDNIYPHPNVGAKNLRQMFRPLDLNQQGFCEQCRLHVNHEEHA
jgi:hypothetical protein